MRSTTYNICLVYILVGMDALQVCWHSSKETGQSPDLQVVVNDMEECQTQSEKEAVRISAQACEQQNPLPVSLYWQPIRKVKALRVDVNS